MKVLIVDDNAQARQMVRHYLSDLAEEIRECADGADALGCYEKFLPDWVLMDWEMKRMDGLTATRHIVKAFPAARILFVTQHDDDELRRTATDAGAGGFFVKDDLLALQSFLAEKREARYL